MAKQIYTDKEYFDEKFGTIDKNFNTVINRLDNLNNNKIPSIEERVDCLEERNKIHDEIKKTFWRRYQRTIEIVGVILAFLGLFYMNQSNKQLIKDVREGVQTTNTYMAPNRSASHPAITKDTINKARSKK
jgi:hypothetical protein